MKHESEPILNTPRPFPCNQQEIIEFVETKVTTTITEVEIPWDTDGMDMWERMGLNPIGNSQLKSVRIKDDVLVLVFEKQASS